jgi:hypothetical protein
MFCKRASLFIGALLGNLEGIRLQGLLREKKSSWVPFLGPEAIKICLGGPSGNLVKEQGSPELILDYGAQRACL